MLIYIAGPLRNKKENVIIENVQRAMKVGKFVFDLGHSAFVPHLYWLSHKTIVMPIDDNEAFKYCFSMLSYCDALVRLPGESDGSNQEVIRAAKWDKPVAYLTHTNKLDVERAVLTLERESLR